jgi:TPR repeat protein
MMETKDEHPSGVGQRYFYGESGKRNYRINLGRAYLDGEGVRPNKRLARIWLAKAAKQNHRQAL